MYQFLANNKEELISRCKDKVAARPRRSATEQQLVHGIPIFLEQLTRTLQAEEKGQAAEGTRISGASGGGALSKSEIGVTAAAHGKELLELGFSVDQVVHDYGDLCQAITDLAAERDAPFTVDEFRTLNRCLDEAIAGAVTMYASESQRLESARQADEITRSSERLGFVVHAKRYLMLTLVEDALREQGVVTPNTSGVYFRLVWRQGLADVELRGMHCGFKSSLRKCLSRRSIPKLCCSALTTAG